MDLFSAIVGSLVKKMLDSRREAEIVQSKSLQNKVCYSFLKLHCDFKLL